MSPYPPFPNPTPESLTITLPRDVRAAITRAASEIHPTLLWAVGGNYTSRLVTQPCLFVSCIGIVPAITVLNLIAAWHLGAHSNQPGAMVKRAAQLGNAMGFDPNRIVLNRRAAGAYYFPAIRGEEPHIRTLSVERGAA